MARIQNLNMIYTLKEWKRFHSHLIGENWNQIERESVGWKSNFFVLGGNSQFKTQHKIHSNFLPPWISLNIIMTNIGLLLNFEYFQMQGNRGEVCCVALCFRTFKEKVKNKWNDASGSVQSTVISFSNVFAIRFWIFCSQVWRSGFKCRNTSQSRIGKSSRKNLGWRIRKYENDSN